jgi:hypothetical protein
VGRRIGDPIQALELPLDAGLEPRVELEVTGVEGGLHGRSLRVAGRPLR